MKISNANKKNKKGSTLIETVWNIIAKVLWVCLWNPNQSHSVYKGLKNEGKLVLIEKHLKIN